MSSSNFRSKQMTLDERICVRYHIRLRALLYLGCVRYYTCVRHISACISIYCKFNLEVRLVSGRHVSACATILACVTLVRALVYCNFLREFRLGTGAVRARH